MVLPLLPFSSCASLTEQHCGPPWSTSRALTRPQKDIRPLLCAARTHRHTQAHNSQMYKCMSMQIHGICWSSSWWFSRSALGLCSVVEALWPRFTFSFLTEWKTFAFSFFPLSVQCNLCHNLSWTHCNWKSLTWFSLVRLWTFSVSGGLSCVFLYKPRALHSGPHFPLHSGWKRSLTLWKAGTVLATKTSLNVCLFTSIL